MSIFLHVLNEFNPDEITKVDVAWLNSAAEERDMRVGELNYVFCSDEQLIKMNRDFLNHDTYTDIITFDYVVGTILSGDIYISTDRVKDNASTFTVPFKTELRRVMVHGLLHLCGQGDKSEEESKEMRASEDHFLKQHPDL